jgi:hypothetical protein
MNTVLSANVEAKFALRRMKLHIVIRPISATLKPQLVNLAVMKLHATKERLAKPMVHASKIYVFQVKTALSLTNTVILVSVLKRHAQLLMIALKQITATYCLAPALPALTHAFKMDFLVTQVSAFRILVM